MTRTDVAELLSLSALQQAECVRQGKISSQELVHLYLDRIDAHNDVLNAFVVILRRSAIKAAEEIDRARGNKSAADGALFRGVPVGVKDLVPTLGTPSRLGSRAFKYFVSPYDGEVAKRIRAGGFISLGKLATSEFGVMPVTEPDIHPATTNPWDISRTPGGSSGGSASAVAAGLLPIAHGSDGGGSVRIPAAFCHLFGFKPSLAHIGNLHGRNNPLGISVMGPLARTVQDAAAMVDVMSGRPDGGSEDISCLAASRREPGKLRVNMLLSSPIGDIDPRIVDATRSFAKTLESLGHTVREIAPVEGTLEEFMPVYRHCVATVPSISEKVLQPVTRWMRRDGRRTTKQEAQAAQASLVDRIQPILEDADVLLSPTVCMGAPKVGAFDAPDDPAAWFASASQVGALTVAFNLTNGPAVSLPMGLLDDGLPFGIQLGARVGADHLLWSLSRQVEDALPWHERHPPAFWPAS